MTLKKRLKAEQKRRGLDQKSFAAFLGLPQSTLSRYMTGGSPRHDQLLQIYERLGIDFLAEEPMMYQRDGPCTESELVQCVMEVFPALSENDASEVVEIARLKAKRAVKSPGKAAAG